MMCACMFTYWSIITRLTKEASSDQLQRMDDYFMFLSTSTCPMKDHCYVIMSTVNEIVDKISCVLCIKETMVGVATIHYTNGLQLAVYNELFEVSVYCIAIVYV